LTERDDPALALEFCEDRIRLLARSDAGDWSDIGGAAVDAPDFAMRMAEMRAHAARLAGTEAPVVLWLPRDHVFVTRISVAGLGEATRRKMVAALLTARFGSASRNMAWGVGAGSADGSAPLAAADRDTIAEACAHARGWGLAPLAVSVRPDDPDLGRGPVFDVTPARHVGRGRLFAVAAVVAAIAAAAVLALGGAAPEAPPTPPRAASTLAAMPADAGPGVVLSALSEPVRIAPGASPRRVAGAAESRWRGIGPAHPPLLRASLEAPALAEPAFVYATVSRSPGESAPAERPDPPSFDPPGAPDATAAVVAEAPRAAIAPAARPDAPSALAADVTDAPPPRPAAATPAASPAPAVSDRHAAAAAPRPQPRPVRLTATRKSVAERIATNSTGSATRIATQRNTLILDEASLIGVFQSDGARHALLRFPDGEIRRVSSGDRVRDWVVGDIDDASVSLRGGDERRTLRVMPR
jgi:hypothetical protein